MVAFLGLPFYLLAFFFFGRNVLSSFWFLVVYCLFILLNDICRAYALAPAYEPGTRPVEDSTSATTTKVDSDETDSNEVILPGVNLIFDGAELHPFDIAACLQARQPISLIAEAAAASSSFAVK